MDTERKSNADLLVFMSIVSGTHILNYLGMWMFGDHASLQNRLHRFFF